MRVIKRVTNSAEHGHPQGDHAVTQDTSKDYEDERQQFVRLAA